MSAIAAVMCDLCGELQKSNCDTLEEVAKLQSKGETEREVYDHLCIDCRTILRKSGELLK